MFSVNYMDIYYYTDTGRTWSNKSANIRDKINDSLYEEIKTTDDLIKFIRENEDCKIGLTVHPERWPSDIGGYLKSYVFDKSANFTKRTIRYFRKNSG